MADFDTLESSVNQSVPVELYEIKIGNEDTLYWTSGNETLTAPTVGGQTYIPEPALQRTNIGVGEEERRKVLSITVSSENSTARRYIFTPPAQRGTVTIYRVQRDDPDLVKQLIYKGAILSAQFSDKGETALIACQTIENASSRIIPRYTFAGMCQHVLYGPGCDVDPAPHTFVSTVSSASGNDITVVGAGASGKVFTGGYVRPQGVPDFRLVLAHNVDVLTLLLPFEKDPTNALIDAFAGCDHLIDGDCAETFDNIAEFGGWPFVPIKNPFVGGI